MIAGLKRLMLATSVIVATAGAAAAVQTQVMVQGYLTNSSGTPYTTPQTAEFRVYQGGNATTAGSGVLYYDETATVSPTASGVFNYALGSGSPTSSFLIVGGGATIPNALTPTTFDTAQPVYLEISVGGFALLPRLQLLGNPYAAIAGLAEAVKPTQQLTTVSLTASSGSFTASGAGQYSVTTASGILVQAGTVSAPAFNGTYYGDGSKLTGVGAASVAAGSVAPGVLAAGVQLPAGSLVNGPVSSSVLPSTVAYTSSPNTFSPTQAFPGGLTASTVTATAAVLTATGTQYSLTTSSGIYVQSGQVTAPAFSGTYYGDGSKLTGVGAASVAAASVAPGLLAAGVQLPAGSLVQGPVAASVLPSTVAYTSVPNIFGPPQSFPGGLTAGTVTATSGSFTASGDGQYSLTASSGINVRAGMVTAPAFSGTYYGDGSKLTGVGAASVTAGNVTPGILGAGVQLTAGSLVAGPVAASILPSTVAYTTSANAFTAPQAFPGGITAASLEVASPGDSLTILGGVYSGPTSGYSGIGQVTSRHALAFRGWSNVAPDTLGVKIEAVNKTAYPTAPWYLAQTSELHLSVLKAGALTKDDTFDEVQVTPAGLNAVDGLSTPKAVTAASASLTASGSAQYSLSTSSGIRVQAGMVSAPAFTGAFVGDGSGLTGVAAAAVSAASITSGLLAAGVQVPAASLTNGPVASSMLPFTVAYTSSANAFTAPQAFPGGLTGSSAGISGGLTASSGSFTASGPLQYSLTTSSGISVQAGMVTAPAFTGAFVGDGSRLAGVAAASVAAANIAAGALPPGVQVSAASLSGQVAPAVLPSTVAYTSAPNAFTAPQAFAAGLSAASAAISGAVNAASATLMAGGDAQYSLTTSSGIAVEAGMVTAPAFSGVYYGDGSKLSGIAPGTPVGAIVMYAGTSEPSGWIECDGRSLSQTGTGSASWGSFNTAPLFAAIGTVWGSAGAGAFNIPDFRGIVPRGYNHGKTGSWSDPDAAARVAQYQSGATGDAIGSYQQDEFKSHTHSQSFLSYNYGTGNGGSGNPGSPTTQPTGAAGGDETRAKNASVMFLVRVR